MRGVKYTLLKIGDQLAIKDWLPLKFNSKTGQYTFFFKITLYQCNQKPNALSVGNLLALSFSHCRIHIMLQFPLLPLPPPPIHLVYRNASFNSLIILHPQWVLVFSPHQNVVSSSNKKCSPQSVLPSTSVLPKVFFPRKVFSPKCSPPKKCSPQSVHP